MASPAQAEVSVTSPVIPDDRLVKVYIKIRDARKSLSKQFDEADLALKTQLNQVATEMKSRCLAAGHTGFKTEFGTVFIVETLKVSCGDWQIFGEFLKDHDPLVFLENRVSSTAIKEFMKTSAGELPPGINVFRETEARVRTPVAKKKAGDETPESEE